MIVLLLAFAASTPIDVTASPHSAVADDGNDDRAAFDSAIAAAVASGGPRVVKVPCGTFDLTITPSMGYAVMVSALDNLTIRGEGPCSVLKAKYASTAGPTNFWLLYLTGVSRVRVEDLTLDGNSTYLASGGEQLHLISSVDAGMTVSGVQFRDSWGDAIKMASSAADYSFAISSIDDSGTARAVVVTLSSAASVVVGGRYRVHGTSRFNGVYTVASKTSTTVTMVETFTFDASSVSSESTGTLIPYAGDVLIERSTVDNMRRNGFTFQKWTGDTTIRDVLFRRISDQAIDMEPSTVAGPRHVLIDGVRVYADEANHLAMALSGGSSSASDATIDVALINSYIEGSLDLVYAGPTMLRGNTVRNTGGGCLTAQYHARDLLIADNHFYCGAGVGLTINPSSASAAQGITLRGNIIDIDHNSGGASSAVSTEGGAGRWVIEGNTFLSRQTGTSGTSAVSIQAKTSGAMRGVVMAGNIIEGFAYGLRATSDGYVLHDVVYDGNVHIDTTIAANGVTCSSGGGAALPWVAIGKGNVYGETASHAQSGCIKVVSIASNGTGTQPTDTTAPTASMMAPACADPDGCIYAPGVSGVKAGRSIEIKNSGTYSTSLTDGSTVVVLNGSTIVLGSEEVARCELDKALGKWLCGEGP
jgi:hypothetical protein